MHRLRYEQQQPRKSSLKQAGSGSFQLSQTKGLDAEARSRTLTIRISGARASFFRSYLVDLHTDNAMTTGNEPPSSSSSTYGAILINPSSLDASRLSPALQNGSSASLVPGPIKHRAPRLLYPIPLVVAAILDVAYSGHHVWQCRESSTDSPTKLLLGLTGLRALVLAGICGFSKRWRSRGGWVAASSGISVGAAIWKDCVDQLTGAELGRLAEESVYLYTVSA